MKMNFEPKKVKNLSLLVFAILFALSLPLTISSVFKKQDLRQSAQEANPSHAEILPTGNCEDGGNCVSPQRSPSITAPSIPKTQEKYVTLAFYPSWIQTTMPPTSIDYTAWTHIMHFGFYPTASGDIGGDLQPGQPEAAVKAAHGKGKKIILVIGSEGTGAQFAGATKAANIDRFVATIVAKMQQYGYDGVDIDWEEQMTQAPLISLMSKLRSALDKISPDLWLSIDVVEGLNPPSMIGPIAKYVNSVDNMTYWSDGIRETDAYVNAGVPRSKICMGIGLDDTYNDTTPAKVQAKIDYIKQNGLKGGFIWSMGNVTWGDPRLIPLRTLIAGN